jgi:probable rRNA maturation factor
MITDIFDETGKLPENLLNTIEQTVLTVAEIQGLKGEFSVDILVTDTENMVEINRSRRKIDRVTDVLSFPMVKGAVDREKPVFLGDIVICLEVLLSQAGEYGHSAEREAGFLTAHGMFHLLGYDHMEEDEEKVMFQKQEEVLDSLGLKR